MTTEYTPNFQLAMPDFRMGPWHDLINGDMLKIDALLFAGLSPAGVDIWRNSTHYAPGITVIDKDDATVWMCVIEHDSYPPPALMKQERAEHPDWWCRLLTGFAPRGEWKQNTRYFPYDLVYDGHLGIMALGKWEHVSTATGNIKTDAEWWEFLIDMSEVEGIIPASSVSYSNTISHLHATNVQDAIDELETQIVQLNDINITQGQQITDLYNKDAQQAALINDLNTRMNAVELKNSQQDVLLAGLQNQINTINDQIAAAAGGAFPSGTILCFFQSVPPTGWNQVNGWSDRAVRLVDAGGGGGGGGGSVFWDSVFSPSATTAGHAVTLAEIPVHDHKLGLVKARLQLAPEDNDNGMVHGVINVTPYGEEYIGLTWPNDDGSGGSGGQEHTHAVGSNMDLAYIRACVGQKS